MPQLKAYHRPTTLDQALALLARANVETAIVAGGSAAVSGLSREIDEVLDLQSLGLAAVDRIGDQLILGAMIRLQTIVDDEQMPGLLRQSARREGPNTLRNAATIGGTVVTANPESELLAALLVCDAKVQIQTGTGAKVIPIGDFLVDVQASLEGGVVTAVSMSTSGITASDRVNRTPTDSPIVAAAARRTDSGQIRLVLCGVADTPILVDPDDVGALNPAGDFRGSTAYRRQMALTLARRVIDEIA